MNVRAALLMLAALAGSAHSASAKPAPVKEKRAAVDLSQVAEYRVKAGETLGGIARRVVVPRVLIIEANGLKPPYVVREGQLLVIPRRRSHVVKEGESGFAVASRWGLPWKAIALANGLDPDARLKTGQRLAIPTLSKPGLAAAVDVRVAGAEKPAAERAGDAPVRFAWPAPGPVRRAFAPRGRKDAHHGIDLSGKLGSAVRAAAPGTVAFAGTEPRTYGNLVILDHGSGWFSAYAKLQKVTVRKGEKVRAGERVGLLGNTGSTSQTELHFEIRRAAVPQDPLDLLPPRPPANR